MLLMDAFRDLGAEQLEAGGGGEVSGRRGGRELRLYPSPFFFFFPGLQFRIWPRLRIVQYV
jgi:hypothetical protein